MADPITFDEMIRELTRVINGQPSADIRFRQSCLVAIAAHLRHERDRQASALDSLARYGCDPGTRVDDSRVSAALERATTP